MCKNHKTIRAFRTKFRPKITGGFQLNNLSAPITLLLILPSITPPSCSCFPGSLTAVPLDGLSSRHYTLSMLSMLLIAPSACTGGTLPEIPSGTLSWTCAYVYWHSWLKQHEKARLCTVLSLFMFFRPSKFSHAWKAVLTECENFKVKKSLKISSRVKWAFSCYGPVVAPGEAT